MQNNKIIKTIKNTKFLNLIMMISVSFSISGCAVYNSSFNCGDAKGADCLSMDRVDRMIASGEIEKFNESRKGCKGKKCSKYDDTKSPYPAEKNKKIMVYTTSESANLESMQSPEVPTINPNVSTQKNTTSQK